MIKRQLACGLLLSSCSAHQGTELTALPTPAFAVAAATDQALELAPPWSLTASDGSGLVLKRVDAKAVLQGPLAFTELHLYFHNPEARIREGTFAITLPPHAAVSRFAMENNGQWMEAEVVEKAIARRAYEDFLHRRQDPALLEKADGNQFTARVFPIPANADKHVVISFSQDVPQARYTLPLRGLPSIEQVSVRLTTLASDGRRVEQVLSERNWQPDRDFVSSAPSSAAIAAGALVATSVAVGQTGGAAPLGATTLMVDTSASRSLGFARTVRALGKLIEQLRAAHGDIPLQVIAFDQASEQIYAGTAGGWGAREEQALLARGAAGASDLGQALAFVDRHSPHPRVVIVGDAVITAGAKPEAVALQLRQLRGVQRVDVVLAGGIRADGVANQLVRAGAQPGSVLDLDGGVEGVVAGLGERVLTDVTIDVPGAQWVYPNKLAAVRSGSSVTVFARMKSPVQRVTVITAGQPHELATFAATPALVGRAFAAAEIDQLELALASATGDAAAKLRSQIASRAVAARVVSSQTSLLVLETEQDYVRYGIDRRGLADILEVAPDGTVAQVHRTAQIAMPPRPEVGRDSATGDARADQAPRPKLADKSKEPAKSEKADEFGPSTGAGVEGGVEGGVVGGVADNGAPASVRDPMPIEPSPPPPPPPPPRPHAEPTPNMADVGEESERVSARRGAASGRGEAEAWPRRDAPAALQGELAAIAAAIARRDLRDALGRARAWHEREPGNVLAWIGLGETLEAANDVGNAARAYGSIIDLFPGRADLRRWAGERLERIGGAGRELAIDTYTRAVADRPDHMTGHRLLAYALLRAGRHQQAFAAILAGLDQQYPPDRFAGGMRVLGDDAGLIGASYAAAVPGKRGDIMRALAARRLGLPDRASTRFVLYWETDANDVDFHIQDAAGGHAFYASQQLPSGGELYADVTTGYGPECFAIEGKPTAGPYKLSLDYYSQGPMGYGMGLLQIVRHDGRGKLEFEDRPFIIMADHAYVDLGTVTR